MAEYIDRTKIKYPKVDSPKGEYWDRFVTESYINSLPTADVIERSKYESLQNQLHHWEHEHAKRILENSDLRSKIDKAIEEIEKAKMYRGNPRGLPNDVGLDRYFDRGLNKALEILKRNIGE